MKIGETYSCIFNVDNKVHESFLALSNDYNPMHVDDSFAQSKGFKSKIVHGNVLGGFLSFFIGESLPKKNVVIQKQSISYHKPFFIGDTVTLNSELSEVYESVSTYIFKYSFQNQHKALIAKGKIQISVL